MSEDWPFPLCLLGEDSYEILWVNQAMQELCGISLRKLIGQKAWDLFETEADMSAMCQKSASSQSAITIRDCDVKFLNTDKIHTCHLTAYPTEQGMGLNMFFTRPRNKETRLGGQVVSGMGRMIAHELKNPLAGIKGAAQLLRDDVATDEGQSLISLIGSEIDRIRRLLDRMETLGDEDAVMNDRVNIHEILRQARLVIQSANPDLVFVERYDPSLPNAIGHADSLMQAVLNLIKNAGEAVDNNGEIILETSFRAGVKSRGKDSSDARCLPIEIRIIDNGKGIAMDRLDQIFQPFVTTKTGGQGLGLALVSKVTQAHGGLVEVISRPGRTVFSLLLPAPSAVETTER
ncbi:MAG: ATP-binding protein [Litorimonas sp.]